MIKNSNSSIMDSFLVFFRWDKGGCRLLLFLVFVVYNSALSKNKFLLLTTNINREYVYWTDEGNIFRNSLHESLFLAPIIILIALFCNLNTHLLLVELPQKNQIIRPSWMKKAKHTIFNATCDNTD